MSKNDSEEAAQLVGYAIAAAAVLALVALAIAAILSALGLLASAGAAYGALNALANYGRAFHHNVRFERVP